MSLTEIFDYLVLPICTLYLLIKVNKYPIKEIVFTTWCLFILISALWPIGLLAIIIHLSIRYINSDGN